MKYNMNMKRGNDEMSQEQQNQNQQQQMEMNEQISQQQEHHYDDSQDNCDDEQENQQQQHHDQQEDYSNDANNFNGNNQNIQNQDNGPNPPKRFRREEEEIRLLIPSKMAGAIIGKGGHNIQKLRTEYKAQVNVGDCQGPERVITIGADLNTCTNVIKDIMKHFDKQGNVEESELRVLLHQSLAGCVIGKGGSKIKELKDKIGCRLKIFSNIAPQSTDRIAQIIGKEEQCIQCLLEIVDLLKTTPIKGPVHNYDPHNFDDVYADEYGGYGSGMNSGGSFRNSSSRFGNNDRSFSGGNRSGGGGGSRGGFDRRGGGSNMDRSNRQSTGAGGMRDYVDPWAHNMNGGNSGPMANSFGAPPLNNFTLGNGSMGQMGNMNSNANNQNNGNGVFTGDMDGKTSTQVTIPKDLAGAIIGKGGGRIRRIRSESNAFIQIDEALPGSTDRIITITGTPKQIQAAQYMLQQSVRENMRRPY